jgi:hypothetical protein
MCLKVARREEVKRVDNIPLGTLLLDPIEDGLGLGFEILDLLLYRLRTAVLGKQPLDPSNPPMHLISMLNSLKENYFGGNKKVYNPYFKYCKRDIRASILYGLEIFLYSLKVRINQLGR